MKGLLKHIGIILLGFALVSCVKDDSENGDEAQKKRAKTAEINVQLGLEYLKQGNVRRAKSKLVKAVELNPRSPDAMGAMAYYLEATGDKNKAQAYYLKAMSYAPGKGAQMNNYGTFLCRQGHYLKANEYFVKASKDINYINSSGALENAGLCSLAIPNVTMAQAYFKRALEQDPSRAQSLYELAKIAYDYKSYKEAMGYLSRLERAGNLRPDALLLAYKTANQMGNAAKAESYAWILKKRFPESAQYKKVLIGNENDKQKRRIS